jgi:transposase
MAELSDRQRRAIEALLTSKSTAEAAARIGISARTIERWKRDPDFRNAYHAASRARLAETVGRLRSAAAEAVETLRAALQDDLTSNRIRAASVLLDTAIKAEIDDLASRVDALEARQQLKVSITETRRAVDEYLGSRPNR